MVKKSDTIGAVAVVGGGIAGVQAALDLADMGYKVYVLEKSPSIGGVMAQLDKTFPTNDCSMCILYDRRYRREPREFYREGTKETTLY